MSSAKLFIATTEASLMRVKTIIITIKKAKQNKPTTTIARAELIFNHLQNK